jgi:hypothetical protein
VKGAEVGVGVGGDHAHGREAARTHAREAAALAI